MSRIFTARLKCSLIPSILYSKSQTRVCPFAFHPFFAFNGSTFSYFLESCDIVGKIPCVDCLRKNKKKPAQFLFNDLELQALSLSVCFSNGLKLLKPYVIIPSINNLLELTSELHYALRESSPQTIL